MGFKVLKTNFNLDAAAELLKSEEIEEALLDIGKDVENNISGTYGATFETALHARPSRATAVVKIAGVTEEEALAIRYREAVLGEIKQKLGRMNRGN